MTRMPPMGREEERAAWSVIADSSFELGRFGESEGAYTEVLARLCDQYPDVVEEVRGQGLLIGLKLKPETTAVIDAAMAERLLVVSAAGNVIRILPPLNVKDAEIGEAIDRLARAFARFSKRAAFG